MAENGLISAGELAFLVENPQPSLLIVDCRLFSDYNQSHVRNAVNAFYSKLMRRRLSCGKVDADFLVSHLLGTIEDKTSLGPCMNLVLYGGSEEMEQISRPTGLCLKRKLEGCPMKCSVDSLSLNNNNNNKESSAKICRLLKSKLDTVDCFSSVLMLEGGFSSFSSAFPSLIESTSSPSLPPIRLSSPLPQTVLPSSVTPSMHTQVPGGSQSQPCLSDRPVGPTMILPFLYLGSQQDAMNTEMLKECGIEYVMNLSVTCPRAITVKDDEEHFLRIPVNDSYMDKLYPYFTDAFEFLEKVRVQKKIVLVHCLAGISRSPTMCISYIMRHLKMDSEDAYKFVKARRSTISPNFNFMGQLLEYERKLRDDGLLPIKEVKEKLDCSPLEASSRPNCCLAPAMKMPKSSSSHAILTSSSRSRIPKEQGVREEDEETTEEEFPSTERNENGKREMQSTPPRSEEGSRPGLVSAPSPPPEEVQRPKMLFSRPRRLDERPSSSLAPSPKNEELPSPSTELSKLSFDPSKRPSPLPHRRPLELPFPLTSSYSSNPCFVSPPEVHLIRREECGVQGKAPSASSTSTANPIFVSPSTEEPSSSKSKESYFSRLSNIFKRNSHSVTRPDCLEKSGEPHQYGSHSTRLSSDSFGSSLLSSSTGVSRSSIHTSSHLSSLPEHSDESGYAHSSTDSFRMARDDPERASLGSTSSHEITVN